MTTLKEAAEIALMALEHPNFQGAEEAEIILRSVLKQHAQQEETWNSLDKYMQEVRSILKRKPLTDEEIAALLAQSAGVDLKLNGGDLLFARAIERAHGIGGKE